MRTGEGAPYRPPGMQLAVGRIVRPHGIRGQAVVEVRTDDPGERFSPGQVLATLPGELGPLTVVSAHPHAGALIVRFREVADRSMAERLRGALLVIDSAGIPPPQDPDEFHDSQLLGLEVRTADGRQVGTVADVLHHGQDLLVIRPAIGGTQGPDVLVPFVAAIVPEVDLVAGRLVIDPPPGLLDDEEHA